MAASLSPSPSGTRQAPCPASGDDLTAFTSRLFRHLERSDQRRWGHAYVAALLSTPGKKSVRRLAGCVCPGAAQSLRQFVSASTWDWRPVMAELADWAAEHGKPRAWLIRTVLLPKRGDRSVGVHRRFDAASGRTVTGQLGVVAFLCVGPVCVPAAWQLALPEQWAQNAQLRRRTRIPESARYQSLWEQVLGLAERPAPEASAAPLVADLSGDRAAEPLVRELARRRRDFVVAVPPDFAVVRAEPAHAGTPYAIGARALTASGRSPDLVLELASADGPARLLSAPIRLPGARSGEPRAAGLRLLAEHLPADRIGKTWITGLPRHQSGLAASLVLLGEHGARAVEQMKGEFGLLDFEGRSFPGWHHHMTLVSAAYAYHALSAAHARGHSRTPLPGPRRA